MWKERAILWIKNKWYWFVLGAILIFGMLFLKGYPDLYKKVVGKYYKLIQKNQEDIDKINRLRKEEAEDIKRILERREQSKKQILEEHSELIEAIDRDRRDKIIEIIDRTSDDPRKMAKEINEFFGIRVLMSDDEEKVGDL